MDKTQLEHLLWNLKPTSESIKSIKINIYVFYRDC